MPDLKRVHRFRDHAVAGVNWRPTRFVDQVHCTRVCGLCRMIPKRTVLLPCSHVLCLSCHAAISQGREGRCPLDQEQFEEGECGSYDFPTRKANALQVYCWNEAHGCEFQGSMEDMLQHFEKECTFHSVECLRCGEGVLHRDLTMHYVAGCSTSVSSALTENTSPESRALTLQDVKNALEEVKTLLREPNDHHVLPVMQSQMNELKEQVRSHQSRLAEITREVAATAETAQHAVKASSKVLQEPTTRQNPAGEASTSSQDELTEQVERQESRVAEITREAAATATAETAQHAVKASSKVLQEPTTRQNPAGEASTSSQDELTEQVERQESRVAEITREAAATATAETAQHAVKTSSKDLQELTTRQNPAGEASTSSHDELTEQVERQESRLAEITREAAATAIAETAHHAVKASSKVLQEPTTRQNPAGEASTSSHDELTEQVERQESRLAEITREAAATATAETAQHAVKASSKVLQEPTTRPNPAGEASTSSSALCSPERVYCWNEAHGCESQGSMEDMLRHFEKECTYHSVECLRCGEGVLHRDLTMHYVAGCSTSVSSALPENTSSESRALTLQDVKNALEEVKTLLREPNDHKVLPVMQSQMNELKEQVKSQESRLAEITREAAATAIAETAQHAVKASSKVLQEPTTRQNPAGETSTSSQDELTQQVRRQESRLAEIIGKAGATVNSETAQHTSTASSTVLKEARARRNPGVNWRPTRFVDEVHSSRVCGLCRMIPKRTVLLPCCHALCQSCLAAISQGREGRCPLDQEQFEEAECVTYDFPTRKANALQVYCWNEAYGCEFQGSMEDMLQHFENECTFHSVECLRCGEGVLHRDLTMHYVAGCSTSVSSALKEHAAGI
ncbi:hypothetical protein MTO96_012277 [Rhipicephalus appendiculatus]